MKVGIIGAGNMAQALLIPLKNFFQDSRFEILIYTPSKIRAKNLASVLDGQVAEEIKQINQCDVIILAHKPQQLMEVSGHLSLDKNSALISMLASIESGQMRSLFGVEKVLRLMPNTPAQVGLGVITYFHLPEHLTFFSPWINALKKDSQLIQFQDESMIDLTTPELGSGPGLVLELIRIFSSSLMQKGLSESDSIRLASSVFYGSGKLALISERSPEVLRDQVTSKGGITHECLRVLKNKNIENIFQQAFKAGHNRSIELKQPK